MAQIDSRAEAARHKILASGDADLINRLHLLEAAAPQARAAAAGPMSDGPRPQRQDGPGVWGMGLAVAGGAWLGTVLGGLALSGEMQRAFAEVAEGLGLDPSGLTDTASTGDEASGDLDGGDGLAHDVLDGSFLDDIGDVFDL
ncbi:MAG: hypothetical protein ACXIU8_15450 [Alkalilacustris sp.]